MSPRLVLFAIVFAWFGGTGAVRSPAQAAGHSDTVRGIVINSVTREPVGRALVYSPDQRFATLTNSEGRFEFTATGKEQTGGEGADSSNSAGPVAAASVDLPTNLGARKPGFLQNTSRAFVRVSETEDVTLELTPEALIVGTVSLPTSEAPDPITLQLFRREVTDGYPRYVHAGVSQSTSDGQFRFADLRAGTYKLLTTELLDSDPLTFDPRGSVFGYPPVYFPNAPDFESAATIELSAGQTQSVHLSLVKQRYFHVKVPVMADSPERGINVSVYPQGHKGPGFTLGFDPSKQEVSGMLPSGIYTLEAVAYGPEGENAAGMQTIAVKGAPVEGPSVALYSDAGIPVNVKEEFASSNPVAHTMWNINGRSIEVKGPRSYLQVRLESADDFQGRRQLFLRQPKVSGDEPLIVDGVLPGNYWVRVTSSRGYVASVRSGDLDLEHQMLAVGAGGTAAPIEITMRDDWGEISGTVEGVKGLPQAAASATAGAAGRSFYSPDGQPLPHLYGIPLPDSNGQFAQIFVGADGSFHYSALVPGAYRLLAFDREQPQLEYRNADAMRAYDSKGPVVRVSGGQKVQVTLQLISTEKSIE